MSRFISIALLLSLFLSGCSFFDEEKTYEWQRPHDTYQVGAFSKAANAEQLKDKLKKSGFDSRIETEIVNGVFYLNVLVDVYDPAPGVKDRLEQITGVQAVLRKKSGGS